MAHPGTDSKRQHQICRKGSTYRREGGAGHGGYLAGEHPGGVGALGARGVRMILEKMLKL